MDGDVFNLLLSLPSKTSYLGLILLTVSVDPYQPNSSLIFHFPVLTPPEIYSLLFQDLQSTDSNDSNEFNEWIITGIIRFFAAQTHSLTELRTLRDLAMADCRANEAKTPRRAEFDE